MTADEIARWFEANFPQATEVGFVIDALGDEGARLSLTTRTEHLRPGGTVSGPTLMTLADTAMYVSLLGRAGLEATTGVTSSLEMHFLQRPLPGRLTAACRLLKTGRRLAVGAVDLHGPDGVLVAHATVTYAFPA